MLHKLTGELFITSDTHFHHKAVIEYCQRPYANVHEMNETLIKRWNERISPKDHVIHDGDFAFGSRKMVGDILSALNGQIYLVRGNHDRKITGDLEKRFVWVKSDFLTSFETTQIHFYHFPVLHWNKKHYGSIQIHGHSHGNTDNDGLRRFDAGVDTNDGYPYHIEEILKEMEKVPAPGRAKKKVCTAEEVETNVTKDGRVSQRGKEKLTIREKLSRTYSLWTS